jgi:hypothetical protein
VQAHQHRVGADTRQWLFLGQGVLQPVKSRVGIAQPGVAGCDVEGVGIRELRFQRP